MNNAEILIPAIDALVIKLLRDTDGYDEYNDFSSLEEKDRSLYLRVKAFLEGRQSYDAETLSEDIVHVFCNEDFEWESSSEDDTDEDEDETIKAIHTKGFNKVVKKVTAKLEDMKTMFSGAGKKPRKKLRKKKTWDQV